MQRPNEPDSISQRVAGEVAAGFGNRLITLFAAGLMAFAGVFLLVGWHFGPQVMLEAYQYRQFTGRVDARIVESWLALEFDAASVRAPEFFRASTNASACVVAEYDGEWGTPLRCAFCGTRVPFNDSYLLADIRDISPGVASAWARDERGFVVPEIRMAPATREWLKSHAPNKFMHKSWPADTAFDWLRIELDRPDDAAVYGWTAPPALLPLSFNPSRPAEALPTALVEKRMAQQPSVIAMLVGFCIGAFVWFKALSLLPLVQSMAPAWRWVFSALPLLTLPWWMDAFPKSMAYFSRDMASVLDVMFSDVDKTNRVVATDPAEATLADGQRMVWNFKDSIYADTMGRFGFVQPVPAPGTPQAAREMLVTTITTQARALSAPARDDLIANLERDKRIELTRVLPLFAPTAKEVAADASASPATRRAAQRLLE